MYLNIDGRSGYLTCDAPTVAGRPGTPLARSRCGAASDPFVARPGGELPDGWVEDTRMAARPAPDTIAHYCPDHAFLGERSIIRRAA